MPIFFWKKNRLIDEFAQHLADELYSNIQPAVAATFFDDQAALIDNKTRKKDQQLHQKVIRSLNSVILQIQHFRELHSLGIYGKARLHMTFTERLKELGYSANITEQINKVILLQTP